MSYDILGARVWVRHADTGQWCHVTIRAVASARRGVEYRVDDGDPNDDSRGNGWTWSEWVPASDVRWSAP